MGKIDCEIKFLRNFILRNRVYGNFQNSLNFEKP